LGGANIYLDRKVTLKYKVTCAALVPTGVKMNTYYDDTLNRISSLDAGIHNPARLMIVFLLCRKEALDYNALLGLTSLTSGNLTTHLLKLEELGYISLTKSFIGRRPNTLVRLSDEGRGAYLRWGKNILMALPEELKPRQLQYGSRPVGLVNRYPLSLREWSFAIPDNRGFSSLPDSFTNAVLPPLPGTEVMI